ncbi:MAG: protein kinase, partial [Ktedonobacteraceae bacterium]
MTTQEQELFCNECGAANAPTARFCQNCASPLPFTHITGTLTEKTILGGRYQLISCIGQGGMGAVYKAADTRFNNRPLAIKEMSKTGLSPVRVQEAESAFEHEALLLADLLHPNLPRIYDHFAENERSYLVMDFIEGQTLEEYLEHEGGGPLPVETVITWGEQLCDVLGYLHSRQPPIIFRDLKPSNVMRDERGHLFLIDFGIARLFKPGQSHDTTALGSPGYAAPEQYGKSQSTPRSDIYSLGALLHHLLTGIDPVDQPFFFRPASQVNPRVDPRLEDLLRRMLEMDPNLRPGSTQEVLQGLRDHTSPLPQQASEVERLLKEARTLQTQHRLDDALKVYDETVKLDATNPLGWQGRGLTQGLRARHKEALDAFNYALGLNPALVVSWNGKGTALSALHRYH